VLFLLSPYRKGLLRLNPRIAIDGPAGAGKSTVARAVAGQLNLIYLDTGAMYRALTVAALRRGVDLLDDGALEKLAESVRLDIRNDPGTGGNLIYLDGEDVTAAIRRPAVSRNVSYVAKSPPVRRIMTDLQRKFGAKGGVVMDGRDIGTHVMPEAEYKFYLTASLAERARRRREELPAGTENVSLEQMIAEIAARDKIDSQRQCAPLAQAPDAILIDTTGMPAEEVIAKIVARVRQY
jgi:cytidylate kinase